jgi:hypothetical protein
MTEPAPSKWADVHAWWRDEISQHVENIRLEDAVLQLKWKGNYRYNQFIADWWPRNELPLLMQELDSPTADAGERPLHYISDIRKYWDWPETLLTLIAAHDESEEDLASAMLSASINPRLLRTRNRKTWRENLGWCTVLKALKDTVTENRLTRVPWCHTNGKPTMPAILPDFLTDDLESLVRYFAREHALILNNFQIVRIRNQKCAA